MKTQIRNLFIAAVLPFISDLSFTSVCQGALPSESRASARQLGIRIGIYDTGKHNAITDVAGVKVGHVTLSVGENVRTGVTAIIPRDDIWEHRVFGAAYVINGNGEATGLAWVNESGLVESPIMLTNTLSVGAVHDGVVRYMIKRYPQSHIILPIVAECYDGGLNDISGLHVMAEHAIEAIENAAGGPVSQGCVGAGTGMRSYGFKAGIGTASRVLKVADQTFTVGVLVNANGGRRHQLRIAGVPVGPKITDLTPERHRDGSFIIVIATDAPLVHRQLLQLARRATHGLARTGTPSTVSSGEFVIAFSTGNMVPSSSNASLLSIEMLRNDQMDVFYQGVIEATEEAVINAMTMAVTTVGRNGNIVHAIPLDRLRALMKEYHRSTQDERASTTR